MRKRPTLADLEAGIRAGDSLILSRAITLVESALPTDMAIADQLISRCLRFSGEAFRLGITGVPGVGKSTFVDAFGMHLIEKGHKVAVLAIDPSSSRSGGSILGDKTRMEKLSQHRQAYIRPSPTGGYLGGVARKTRESILLCEAAGYDIVMIETVGVGQSEMAVYSMVDFFMLLMLPHAGDELQGMKKGIMEMVDAMIINKADGAFLPAAKQAKRTYEQALHLFAAASSGWNPRVHLCSALEQRGLAEISSLLEEFRTHAKEGGHWKARRHQQDEYWMETTIRALLEQDFYQHQLVEKDLPAYRAAVLAGEISPVRAARSLIESWKAAKD